MAIIVGLRLPSTTRGRALESLEELAALARASGARVVDKVLQSRARVDGRTYFGPGKAAELKESAADLGANMIILDHDLSPAQSRNLEKITDLKIVDRTELILDIFARRARTPLSKMQVEAAQLEYFLPRLRHLWSHLSRTAGGIGARGPGETQLEVDRRRVRDRLARLRRRIQTTSRRREVQRGLHPDVYRVALVGYTNTGKSSLMNRLTTANVESGNRPFETLDATTRVLPLGRGTRTTLTDTVGFVRKLPHGLIDSFRATLEEVSTANLLLHVVDTASPHGDERRETVDGVLREIGAGEIPQILVHNKCDLVEKEVRAGLEKLHTGTDSVFVSALSGDGLEELAEAVFRRVRSHWVELEGIVPHGASKLHARLRSRAEIVEESSAPNGTRMRIRIDPGEWERLRATHREETRRLARRTANGGTK